MKFIRIKILGVAAVLGIVIFFSTYKLTESPRTWIDEGVYIQVARNFAHYNIFQAQTAPGEFEPSIASYVTTGYTVTYPLSLIFKFFGGSLLQARILMAIFIILSAAAGFLLLYKIFGYKTALISAFLLVSFAPLYGNGKNVMGEVPGVFFLILSLLSMNKLEETRGRKLYYVLSGLTAGLAAVTKPVFFLLIPAIAIPVFRARKKIGFNFINLLCALTAFFIPLVIFYLIYFGKNETIPGILSFYIHVNSASSGAGFLAEIKENVVTNLNRFVSEFTPAYFLVLTLIWSGCWAIRIKFKQSVKLAEETALVFTVLIGLAYLKIPGAYRYFFPGHIMAVLFFPAAFLCIFKFINRRFARSIIPMIWPVGLLVFLIVFQFYQVGFSSWVAGYYNSTRSRELREYFGGEKNKRFFIYQAPEIVTFLPTDDYFQFFAVVTKLVGNRNVLLSAVPDEVVVPRRNYNEAQQYLGAYKEKTSLAGGLYHIFERK